MNPIYGSDEARRAVETCYRRFLDRWPVPSAELTVSTRHGDTFIVASGSADAPPVVLLHGAGFNSAAWMADAATWSQARRVYAVDVLGEPGLSAPSRPPLDSGAYAEWLDDVLDGLGVTRAAFVGASLGGWLALDYALRRPERVTRLALLVPGGIGRQKYGAILGSLFLMPFGGRGRRAALRFILGPAGPPAAFTTDASLLREFDDFLFLVQNSYRPRRDRLPVFPDDQLRGLGVPLRIIAGAKDRLLDSPGTARRVRRLVPHATVTLLPGTGHIPTAYTESLQEFLTEGDPA